MKKTLFLSILTTIISLTASASQVPHGFIYRGQVLRDNGVNKVSQPVDVVFGILAPNGCLLYEEKQVSVDSSTTSGMLMVSVGTDLGSPLRTAKDSGYTMEDVFTNSKTFPATANCAGGYVAKDGDVKTLHVQIALAGGTLIALSPDLPLAVVPWSMVTQTLQGQIPSNFISASATTTQLSADLLTGGVDVGLAHNHDSLYLKKTDSPSFTSAGVSSVGSTTSSAINKTYDDNQIAALNSSVTTINNQVAASQTTVVTLPSQSFVDSSISSGVSGKATIASVNSLNANISTASNLISTLPVKSYVDNSLISLNPAISKNSSDVTALQSSAASVIVNPTGFIMSYAGARCPVGFLSADGSAYKNTDYSALSTVLYDSANSRYLYGNPDSTHFNVPDLRGQFLRGLDPAGVRDLTPGRVVGSTESDSMQGHMHVYGNTPSINFYVGAGGAGFQTGTTYNGPNYTPSVGNPTNDGGHGNPRTASESRPKNAAVLYCIKY